MDVTEFSSRSDRGIGTVRRLNVDAYLIACGFEMMVRVAAVARVVAVLKVQAVLN